MPHTHKKKKFTEKKITQEKKKLPEPKKEHGSVRAIADAIILSINDNYITYREFKMIQALIDEKFDKPSWAMEKK